MAEAGRRKNGKLGKEGAVFFFLRRKYVEENIDADGGYCLQTIR